MSPHPRSYGDHYVDDSARNERPSLSASRRYTRWILNSIIAVLFLSVVYLSYAFFAGQFNEKGDAHAQQFTLSAKLIQIDVLNGCGVSGAASKTGTYLRKRGFDVVEVRNYKSFEVKKTLVVDRVGNLGQARRVARALGVDETNILQEINYDYYVEVSVVVGKDFPSLRTLYE